SLYMPYLHDALPIYALKIAELFSEKPDFVNVTGKWWNEKSEIQKAHDFGFRVIFSNSHLEVLKIKKKELTEDIAVIHSKIRVTGDRKSTRLNSSHVS